MHSQSIVLQNSYPEAFDRWLWWQDVLQFLLWKVCCGKYFPAFTTKSEDFFVFAYKKDIFFGRGHLMIAPLPS